MYERIIYNKYTSLILGLISGLAFAPIFFILSILVLAILCLQVRTTANYLTAASYGFIFGIGHFLAGIYWIAVGVGVYIEEFWWALPFALLGLPVVLACFIASSCAVSWIARNSSYYHFIFCLCWVFFEWIRSWIFTGLPWNLLGYVWSFSKEIIQIVSVVGVYGLSLVTVYISTHWFYLFTGERGKFKASLITSVIALLLISGYGIIRLHNNPTKFLNITARLVQPSIPQEAKWEVEKFWQHLNQHIRLSTINSSKPDMVIWSEAALVVPYTKQEVMGKLLQMLKDIGGVQPILLTGGVADNNKEGERLEIYTTLSAIGHDGSLIFQYHKSHLVPFGEYMPLRTILPFKKLTPGFIDYTPGKKEIVNIPTLGLIVKPLICYEAVFPEEVRTSNQIADVIVNVTNDTWYGRSSGPYQHFYISYMRAVENGLPMIRVANNGISAVIDPLGRVIKKLEINEIGFIDSAIPQKLTTPTIYSLFENSMILIIILLLLLIEKIAKFLLNINTQNSEESCFKLN